MYHANLLLLSGENAPCIVSCKEDIYSSKQEWLDSSLIVKCWDCQWKTKKPSFLWSIQMILQASWIFPLSTCPHCTFLVPLSYRQSGWVLSCALSNSLRTTDAPTPNHGWLSAWDTKVRAVLMKGLVYLPPYPNKTSSWDMCANKNWSQQLLLKCKQKV